MKIGIVGLGHVGAVTACVLASQGNSVYGVDVDTKVIEGLIHATPNFYEPGLEDLLNEFGHIITFNSDYSVIKEADIVFVTVPTPNRLGMIDLHTLIEAVSSVKEVNRECIVVIKSTVTPGTARELSELTGMVVISNPEFTREGNALKDTVNPDRIVVGGQFPETKKVASLWEFTKAPVIITTNENAELIKYASNSFLATKISFINEIANLCEKIPGADVKTVANGMGLDKRIGEDFLSAGLGFGGSCLPKDAVAFSSFARKHAVTLRVLESAIKVNEERIRHAIKLISHELNEEDRKKGVCILGLSFKDNTNDIRESQSLKLINELRFLFSDLNVYDPLVQTSIDNVKMAHNMNDCVESSGTIVISTEWREFADIPHSLLKGKLIIDLRRVLDEVGIENYIGIGYGYKKGG